MNKDAALASLGLSGQEDTATIARVYGERLTAVQELLGSAQSDADRGEYRTKLSELVEAYECVTSSGRYTKVGATDDSATVMRSDVPPAVQETFVRMEPGAVLSSRLEIGQLLGQGGMGNVYAARDRLKNEDVAIKVLRQDLLYSTSAKDRFLAEAKVSCSLSHPNIVRVHDVGMSGNYYYLSMERLKGHTLRQRIEAYRRENREFDAAEVTDIARQLIDALRYAHRYIVHRDLKPENVWLAEDGTVKLMDFGIARAYSNSQLTQTGMALGTAYYMAPEQRIAAKEVDWRADQYALGVMLYELLAGTLPTGAVRPLDTIRRDVPKRYAQALMRAMEPKPDERFPSLNALLAEIEAPHRRIAGARAWLLIGAGLAAAGAGAFVVYNNQAADPAEARQVAAATETAANAGAATSTADAPVDSMPPVDASPPSDGAPPTEPPPTSEADRIAATPLPESDESKADTPAASASDASKPARESPPRVAMVDQTRSDGRRQQCITQCERDEAECRSLNRRGKQDCMRAVAFGAGGPRLSTGNPAAVSCAFYGKDRCSFAPNRDACMSRMANRNRDCVALLGGSIASKRQDCEDKARGSDKLCLDELRDCRTFCE
jgi:hypothetical protein